MKTYNNQKALRYCEQLGLVFDDEAFRQAVAMAALHDLSQEALDAAVGLHARQMALAFTPSTYRFIDRLFIAFIFIFGIDALSRRAKKLTRT